MDEAMKHSLDWSVYKTLADTLFQRHPHWGIKKLGSSDKTIGEVGCALCCLTGMTSIITKMFWTPGQMNYLFKHNNGYKDNDVVWNILRTLFGIRLKSIESYKKKPALLKDVSIPFIAQIEANMTYKYHYVLVVDKIARRYIAIDPYFGDVFRLLDRYAEPTWNEERLITQIIQYETGGKGVRNLDI